MHWYYADEGVQVGPLTETEFEDLVRIGKITDETIVWRDGLSEWQPYGRIRTRKQFRHLRNFPRLRP